MHYTKLQQNQNKNFEEKKKSQHARTNEWVTNREHDADGMKCFCHRLFSKIIFTDAFLVLEYFICWIFFFLLWGSWCSPDDLCNSRSNLSPNMLYVVSICEWDACSIFFCPSILVMQVVVDLINIYLVKPKSKRQNDGEIIDAWKIKEITKTC